MGLLHVEERWSVGPSRALVLKVRILFMILAIVAGRALTEPHTLGPIYASQAGSKAEDLAIASSVVEISRN